MPAIDLPEDELAAVMAAILGVIEGDRYPLCRALSPASGAGEARGASKPYNQAGNAHLKAAPEPTPHPKAAPAAKGDKRARR